MKIIINILILLLMDIEEIKCPLCSHQYNEQTHLPILLPDCGHSFCHACIQDCFKLLQLEQDKRLAVPYGLAKSELVEESDLLNEEGTN
jgi:RING-type zinc-finger